MVTLGKFVAGLGSVTRWRWLEKRGLDVIRFAMVRREVRYLRSLRHRNGQ